MKNKTSSSSFDIDVNHVEQLFNLESRNNPGMTAIKWTQDTLKDQTKHLSEILFVTSYPPRECGIATYSQDLIKALNNKFSNSLTINVCALETDGAKYNYPEEVKYILDTSLPSGYDKLAKSINEDEHVKIVFIQHEFGFFKEQEDAFVQFLYELAKPIVLVFHTVLPNPDEQFKIKIQKIASICKSLVVMTYNAAEILSNNYNVPLSKISVIAHGTHLVPHLNVKALKKKYGLTNRKVLTTFGLLSSGKSIETTINSLPAIVAKCPDVVFLIIGKTHPEVKKIDGEKYRESLEKMVVDLNLQKHVQFVNNYLALPELLEYLQLTDIYLFTTSDRNQAVSGTFAYAMSCACPIISTPIPHAKEVLNKDTGIIFDFQDSKQLAKGVIKLLNNNPLRKSISSNTLQYIVSTAWENSAVAHAMLFEQISGDNITIKYNLPDISLDHLKKMTTNTGMIQFSKINQPDLSTGYTLDDNARAMVASCMYFDSSKDNQCIADIRKYLGFIKFCQQPDGGFMNYVDKDSNFTEQNKEVNLDDSNGRAIWALGFLVSLSAKIPEDIRLEAEEIIEKSLLQMGEVHSPRAMAFAIKGLYYYHKIVKSPKNVILLKIFANRLVNLYQKESSENWDWFEGYLTYANSILPEAMLYSWLVTKDKLYKDIALSSFDFLLSHTFNDNGIQVISNRNWLQKGLKPESYGEQPIDVAYTIMTLRKFYDVFEKEEYRLKMETAFNWFLGKNRLHQIVYNPCTGGCYDGLEETHVNLNQGAESTVSYLMARLTMEKHKFVK
ncbi:MAG: glycosyltransferase [Bacteroidota bacterium]